LSRGQRKDDVANQLRSEFDKPEGVVFSGKAQEKCSVYRTEKRHNSKTNKSYAWVVKSTAMVNPYYFYCVDEDFGPFFIKFCSYFPDNAKLCLNRHEYAKRQLQREGLPFQALDNGVLSCENPKRLQEICDALLLRSTGFSANGFNAYRIRSPAKIAGPVIATRFPSCKLNCR